MPYVDLLFAGIPKGPVRAFLAEAITRHKPNRVVIPCAGSFALADAALQGGLKPNQIVAGDISLYSSVIGAVLSGQPIQITPQGPALIHVAHFMNDPVTTAAGVLYMIRWNQYSRKNQKRAYWRDHLRELEGDRDFYLASLRDQLLALKDKLGGLTYQARDLWEMIAEYQADPKTMIWLDPPWYAKGYDKMFAGIGECFAWDGPHVPQFDPKQYARLMDTLANSAARTYVMYPTDGEDPAEVFKAPWRSVFGLKTKGGVKASAIWVMCNHDDESLGEGLTVLKTKGPRFLIHDGSMPTPASNLRALMVPAETAEYYQGLFVHRINAGQADCYAALMLDGKILAIIGSSLAAFFGHGAESDRDCIHVIYHFPAPLPAGSRLNKLMMLALSASWFWQDIAIDYSRLELLGPPKWLQTTMLTRAPSSMLVRGTAFKLVSREKNDDGYKLNYRAATQQATRQETLGLWLTKYAM